MLIILLFHVVEPNTTWQALHAPLPFSVTLFNKVIYSYVRLKNYNQMEKSDWGFFYLMF